MHRNKLLASALALAIAGAASFAIAQDAAQPVPSTATPAMAPRQPMQGTPMDMARMHHGARHRQDRGMDDIDHAMRGPHTGAAADLHALERLYQDAGRSKELPALYNDVLARTQDPMLRTYVYHRLARLQMQPANVDQAAATLRKSLDENLASEAKQRAEREKMRSQWQQRRAAASPGGK